MARTLHISTAIFYLAIVVALSILATVVILSVTELGPTGLVTATATVNVTESTTISMNQSTVSFENMAPSETNNTDDDKPKPFVIRNDGNVLVNITIGATNMFSTTPNPTTNYQFNSTQNESSTILSPVVGQDIFGYTNVPVTASPTKVIGRMNYTNANDQVTVNINVTIPSDEGAGNKSSTVTFTASAS